MAFQAINGNVAVLMDRETVSKGGIVIPIQAQKIGDWGVVESKGGKVKELEVGDRVLISRYAGTEFKRGENDVVVMDEKHVLAMEERQPEAEA